jgi:hypothetical protein
VDLTLQSSLPLFQKADTSVIELDLSLSAVLTTDDTKCTLSGTGMLADQEQMRSACLEVVEGLEAYEQ